MLPPKKSLGQNFLRDENVARIKRQNSRRISVIIGNPPYNANQANENDNNKNREYPAIDARIKQTYVAESTAQKTKLYDMYARFFRWASDRLDANGVLAFVVVHIAALILHEVRQRVPLAQAMVSGFQYRKTDKDEA